MSDDPDQPITLHHLGHIPPQTGWGMVEHVHADFHEFIFILHGDLTVRIHNQLLHGKRGDMLLYPANHSHSEQATGDEPLETLFLGWQSCDAISCRVGQLPLLVNDRNGRMQMLMHWMREKYPAADAETSRQIDILLDALLIEYEFLAQTPAETMIGQVKTFIQHHLAESITLDDLARQAGLSKFHFSREFKLRAGISPMAFLRQERVEAARALLLSTPWTLSAIARQVGFADEFQLSRVFRRLTGVPPSHLRR